MNSPSFLLDVSTLVALLWQTHSDHARTKRWCSARHLAVCPITELGFLRVVTSPAYNASMQQAREVLQHFFTREAPDFIPADVRALDGQAAPSSAKTTDWYLANLADAHGMKWATLDTRADHPSAVVVI